MSAKDSRRPDIGEDLAFQKRDWVVQRIGWAVLAMTLLAGLAGLLGRGPLSRVTTGDAGALLIHYERFVRHGAHTELQLGIDSSALSSGNARISISRAYMSALRLQQVTPAPVRVQTRDDALVYVFETLLPAASMHVAFELQPDRLGRHDASIALNDGPPVSITQFTYP